MKSAKLKEYGEASYSFGNMIFELGNGQIFLKDKTTKELIRAIDVKNDFNMRDLKEWCFDRLPVKK